MALLSLRATISFLSALSVAVVASITLSITLTTSISALRDIGQNHATSLLANARLQVEYLFHRPAIATETIVNTTHSKPWAWPSDDPDVYAMYRTMVLNQFLACEGYCTLSVFFSDSTYYQVNAYDVDIYWGYVVSGAPYSIGGLAYQLTQPVKVERFAAYWANHTSPPPTHPVFNQTVSTVLIASTETWRVNIQNDGVTFGTTFGGVTSTPGALERNSVTMFSRSSNANSSAGLYLGISVALDLAAVEYFLKGIAGTPNTRMFAYDNGGYLIGTNMNTPYQVQFTVNASYVPPPGCSSTVQLGDFAAGVLVGICRSHVSQYGYGPLTRLASDNATTFAVGEAVGRFEEGGDTYYYAVSKVFIKYPGMGIWMVLIMPEADVLGDVVTGRNTAIGVTCGVFVVAVVATFVVVALLLRPLSSIADRMLLAAALEDDGSDDGKALSSMTEVEQLQLAYFAMNEELNRIKSFVPKAALRKTLRDADGADDPDLMSGSGGTQPDNTSTHSNMSTSRRSKMRLSNPASHLECGLTAQSVTVLSGNMDSFDELVQATPREAVVARVAQTVQMVHEAAAAHKGVVQSFHGDHFVVTYNAVAPCPAHARRGAATALQLSLKANDVGLKLPLRAGVATGKCLVGNLGSQDAKAFNVIGSAFVQAGLLERLTRTYGPECHVLATRRTCGDIATHLRFRYLDIIPLPREATLIGAVLGLVGTEGDSFREVEWLYVVGDRPMSVDDAINDAFVALAEGRREACATMLSNQPQGVDAFASKDGIRCRLRDIYDVQQQHSTTPRHGLSLLSHHVDAAI